MHEVAMRHKLIFASVMLMIFTACLISLWEKLCHQETRHPHEEEIDYHWTRLIAHVDVFYLDYELPAEIYERYIFFYEKFMDSKNDQEKKIRVHRIGIGQFNNGDCILFAYDCGENNELSYEIWINRGQN